MEDNIKMTILNEARECINEANISKGEALLKG